MKNFLLILFVFTLSSQFLGQEMEYSFTGISPELTINSNAVIRDEQISIAIDAVDKMTVKTKRVITVLNIYGDGLVGAYEFYDGESKIKHQNAVIYDSRGKEIKKYRQKDFNDRSAVGNGTLYSDNRVRYLEYTPQNYPYTIVYESEITTNTTVFIKQWKPVDEYFLSVEKSSYRFINEENIPYRLEENNFEGLNIEKIVTDQGFTYTLKELPAYKKEYLSRNFEKFTPTLKVALNEFSLVGVTGSAKNWSEFGKWQYDHLLAGRNQLPESTLNKIGQLTAGVEDPVEKAKIIYQFVQDNTRYISVQLGIGGWEPISANEVDHMGYGDCKGLTNYTKALLESQNIESYYAVVHAGEEIKDIDPDFASMQGNHVILNIPRKDGDIWLECTSQTMPFDYIGDFTDNRSVLLIKPGGGEIVKTRVYTPAENVRETYAKVYLDKTGAYTAEVSRSHKGILYGNIYYLMKETSEKQHLFYKNNWVHMQDLEIENIEFKNDREQQSFIEKINLKGEKIAAKAGNRLLLPTSFIPVPAPLAPRNTDRKQAFAVDRGYTYKDTFEFILPQGYNVESIPMDELLEFDFGKYSMTVLEIGEEGEKRLKVTREYIVYAGEWDAARYEDYRNFLIKINTLNNAKAVLISST